MLYTDATTTAGASRGVLIGKGSTQDALFYKYEVEKIRIFGTSLTTAETVVIRMTIQSDVTIQIPGLTASRIVQ